MLLGCAARRGALDRHFLLIAAHFLFLGRDAEDTGGATLRQLAPQRSRCGAYIRIARLAGGIAIAALVIAALVLIIAVGATELSVAIAGTARVGQPDLVWV